MLKPCRNIRCGNLTEKGYCDECKAKKLNKENRPNSYQRGYNYKWQKASKSFLMQHPLCAECERQGRITLATCVDHITPHKGNMKLFWNTDNWQPLCDSCHSKKTVKEDMGRWYK